jgi:16S rRNA (guanine(966)-N(2))-methyltransferase RsmD
MNASSRKPAASPPAVSARGKGRGASQAPLSPQHAAAAKVARSAAQEVRIIGGLWKRTPLPVPVSAGLRPMPSRVRETLFNWLGQDLSGWRVLDAFAGSGALGLEAASRGAEDVTLLEREPALARPLQQTVAKLKAQGVKVLTADALAWMRLPAQAARFDLIFLDPPFDAGLFLPALAASTHALTPGAWVYLEAAEPWSSLSAQAADGLSPQDQARLAGLLLHREGKAGAVHFHLFQSGGA